MNTTQATLWFIATALMLLVVVGGGILMSAKMLHMPHRHHARRHAHPHR